MESRIPIKETNNDSDSSEKSWVLVDENPSENSQNTFVLNCNREPILELTQEDLGVEVSDGEFDLIEQDGSSDGISVISDEEVDLDPIEEKLVETLTDDSKNRVYVHSLNDRINHILDIMLALSFIMAFSIAFGHYIGSTFNCINTATIADKLHDKNETLKSSLSMLENNECQQFNQNGVAEYCMMPDNLGSLQNLIKDVEYKEVGSDNISADPVTNIQSVVDENSDCATARETKEYVPETEDVVKQKKRKESGEFKKDNKKNKKGEERHIKEKKKQLRYKNEQDDDDDDDDNDDEINGRPKKMRKQNKLNGRDGYDDKKFKKWKREGKPLDDEFENIDEDEDNLKKFKKWIKQQKKNYKNSYKKSKNSKHRSHVNKNDEDRKNRKKIFVNEKFNDTEYVNGQWMERLAEARKEYRQNAKRSEWIFDRANARKNSRNKAKWYFDRMWDREVYRQQSL